MRRLAQPKVLQSAAMAALLTAACSYPRLYLWLNRPSPIWYLEAIVFSGTTILWGFVFAWHTHYCQRPVFTVQLPARDWALGTVAAILVATILHFFLDPFLRQTTPQDYPADVTQWLAMTLFNLSFIQLFLVFAPFAWLMRLVQNRRVAIVFTVLVGLLVLVLKVRSSATLLPPTLLTKLVLMRIVIGFLSISLYLRGGVMLVWWWSLLLETRHLVMLAGRP